MAKWIRNLSYALVGNALLAFSVIAFILPYNILTGGVAGVAVLFRSFLPLPVDTVVIVLNIALFILGSVTLGKEFSMTTLLSTIAYPVFLKIFGSMHFYYEVSALLASLYGGLIGGVGIGLVMLAGGSTGGMDVPPMILHKYLNVDVSKGVFFFDALTVLLGLVFYNLEAVMIGLISVYGCSAGIARTLSLGGMKAKKLEIVSDEHEKICKALLDELDRGVTILEGRGAYTGNGKPVLMCVIMNSQYPKAIELINQFDESAFIVTSDVYNVHGEGFTYEARI